tara:strand:+ start:699 stop:953 length:255 start_codon:yes stop_codon:yes gene_type:complete
MCRTTGTEVRTGGIKMLIEIGESGVFMCSTRQGVGIDFQFLGCLNAPLCLVDEQGSAQLFYIEGFHIRLPFFEISIGILHEVED